MRLIYRNHILKEQMKISHEINTHCTHRNWLFEWITFSYCSTILSLDTTVSSCRFVQEGSLIIFPQFSNKTLASLFSSSFSFLCLFVMLALGGGWGGVNNGGKYTHLWYLCITMEVLMKLSTISHQQYSNALV